MTNDTSIWLQLRWPREVRSQDLESAWRMLGAAADRGFAIEAVGNSGFITHWIRVSAERQDIVSRELESTIPGLSVLHIEETSRRPVEFEEALSLRLNTRRRSLRIDDYSNTSRALLTALSAAKSDEEILIRWTVGRRTRPAATSSQMSDRNESWPLAILESLVSESRPIDRELHKAFAEKRREATWHAIGYIAVNARTKPRREKLLRHVMSALRSLEAPGVHFTAGRANPKKLTSTAAPWRWPLRLNALEMAALSTWPVDSIVNQPVSVQSSRLIPPSRRVSIAGRTVALSNKPGDPRPLSLTVSSSLRHLHVLGPTGTGKSTALLNLINQDLHAGRGVVVIESKGDLIRDVLATMPERRLDDVVVLDPTDDEFPVGINPLALKGRSPDFVADQLLGTLHSLYRAHWGPRTHDILGSALLTLARIPGSTLCALPVLLTDPAFRRKIVGHVNDPIALGPFWAHFDSWSEAERTAATAPVLNKIRPMLMNPRLRAILGQEAPPFHLEDVFAKRRVLLVNLAKGAIGPEASALLGSLVVAGLWQAALERTSLAPNRRHPVFIYVDEFQDYLHLPTDLSDALGQARGLGVGFTLAHQHLHQLDPSMRSAVLANARSRLCFQLPLEDAKAIAPPGTLPSAEEFTGLGAFECYAQLMAEDMVHPWCSGRTVPPPPALRDQQVVREHSRRRYGTPRSVVEAGIASLIARPESRRSTDDLSPRRRPKESS